jgi:hypothetical protein
MWKVCLLKKSYYIFSVTRYFIFLSMHNCILFSRKCSVLKQIRYQVYFYTICLIFFWSCWFVSLTPKWRNYFLLSELKCIHLTRLQTFNNFTITILQCNFTSAIFEVKIYKCKFTSAKLDKCNFITTNLQVQFYKLCSLNHRANACSRFKYLSVLWRALTKEMTYTETLDTNIKLSHNNIWPFL